MSMKVTSNWLQFINSLDLTEDDYENYVMLTRKSVGRG